MTTHDAPSCAGLTTFASWGSRLRRRPGDLAACFGSSSLTGVAPLFSPQSSSPLIRFRTQRRRGWESQASYLLNAPHAHLALYSFPGAGGNQNNFTAYREAFHAVFQGMLVYMRFWKCLYAWKSIISLSNKTKQTQKSLSLFSGSLEACRSAGRGRWAGD